MNDWNKYIIVFFSFLLVTTLTSVNYAADSTVKNKNDPPINPPKAPHAQGSYGPDLCALGSSSAASLAVIGYSQGSQYIDEVCRAIRLSKQMATLGLKVGAVSLLCINNKDVIIALFHAGSPCPVHQFGETLVGKKASDYWSKFEWVTGHYAGLMGKPKYGRHIRQHSLKSKLHEWN